MLCYYVSIPVKAEASVVDSFFSFNLFWDASSHYVLLGSLCHLAEHASGHAFLVVHEIISDGLFMGQHIFLVKWSSEHFWEHNHISPTVRCFL